jgi:hypothetical protein
MGVTETVPAPETATNSGPAAAAPPPPSPAPFLAARPPEARLEGLLAFALAAEAGDAAATPETLAKRGAEADRLLTEHAYRLLHNHVAEIRREAVAEHMAALRPPLGFWASAAACLAALAVAGLGALWLVAHPSALAAAVSLLGG